MVDVFFFEEPEIIDFIREEERVPHSDTVSSLNAAFKENVCECDSFIQYSDQFLLIIMSISGALCLLRLYLLYFLSVGLGEFAPGVRVYIPAGARRAALSERNR